MRAVGARMVRRRRVFAMLNVVAYGQRHVVEIRANRILQRTSNGAHGKEIYLRIHRVESAAGITYV